MPIPYGLIYKTENLITADIYIGQTTKLRDSSYLGSGLIIMRAIAKYGRENFEREVICYCKDKEDLDHKERLYIALIKPSYNIGLGGSKAGKLSIESREKLRIANIGKRCREETKEKLRQANLGKKYSQETKDKLSRIGKGKKHILTEEGLQKRFKAHAIKVLCMETNILYDSIKDAALSVNGDKSAICMCCKGDRNTAYGFHWKYA
jgi:group I intron endonuclease